MKTSVSWLDEKQNMNVIPNWSNGPLTLFHGTTCMPFETFGLELGEQLAGFSVDFSKLQSGRDFGRGFYLTTNLDQAVDWANQKSKQIRHSEHPIPDKSLVLRFDIDREHLGRMESMSFLLDNPDFKSFIMHCRQGNDHHGHSSVGGVYDVVSGPVVYYPQRAVFAGCDQISFHSSSAALLLGKPIVFKMGSELDGLIHEGYLN